MAVDAINDRISSKTSNLTNDKSPQNSSEYKNMTAQEILDAYNNQGLAVPKEVLEWAQNIVKTDPNSTVKYGEQADIMDPNDAVSYIEAMMQEGMSLYQMGKEMRDLTAQMEERDLENVTKMAQFIPEIPQNEEGGNTDESEVSKLLAEFVKEANADAKKGSFLFGRSTAFKEDLRFFSALDGNNQDKSALDNAKDKNQEEVEGFQESLEDISDVLSDADNDSKQSVEYGNMAILVGDSLRKGSKGILNLVVKIAQSSGKVLPDDISLGGGFFGFIKRRILGRKVVKQGEKTVAMGEKTNKLANALAKDNNIVLDSLKTNEENIENAGNNNGSGEGEGAGSGSGSAGEGSSSGGGSGTGSGS